LPDAITFVHLSDLHLGPPGELVFNGLDPVAQARRVLARIGQLDVTPKFIVISGDLSNDGSAASYETLNGLMRGIDTAATPVLLALGNHDDRSTFRRTVIAGDPPPGSSGDASVVPTSDIRHPASDIRLPYCHSQVIAGLRVVVLDSSVAGEEYGLLDDGQLAWLDEQLRLSAPLGSLVVLHHCCRLASSSFDVGAFGLRNAAAFEAVVARHPVLGVLAGHSHQANAAPFAGTVHITAPATLCQLDFFAGPTYQMVPGAGFNLCQIEDGRLIVHPVIMS
jgi:3',5'-cyclic AMP phosphodiesterase CpdA